MFSRDSLKKQLVFHIHSSEESLEASKLSYDPMTSVPLPNCRHPCVQCLHALSHTACWNTLLAAWCMWMKFKWINWKYLDDEGTRNQTTWGTAEDDRNRKVGFYFFAVQWPMPTSPSFFLWPSCSFLLFCLAYYLSPFSLHEPYLDKLE